MAGMVNAYLSARISGRRKYSSKAEMTKRTELTVDNVSRVACVASVMPDCL